MTDQFSSAEPMNDRREPSEGCIVMWSEAGVFTNEQGERVVRPFAIGYPEDAVPLPYVSMPRLRVSGFSPGEWSSDNSRLSSAQGMLDTMVAQLADAYIHGRARHAAKLVAALDWIQSIGVVARFNDSRIEITQEGFEALAAYATFKSERRPEFDALMGIPVVVVEGWGD